MTNMENDHKKLLKNTNLLKWGKYKQQEPRCVFYKQTGSASSQRSENKQEKPCCTAARGARMWGSSAWVRRTRVEALQSQLDQRPGLPSRLLVESWTAKTVTNQYMEWILTQKPLIPVKERRPCSVSTGGIVLAMRKLYHISYLPFIFIYMAFQLC